MAKTISFTKDKVKYTLEFTRATVVQMEKDGFNIQEASTAIVSTIPTLFAGAFLAHHPDISEEKIDELYVAMPDKNKLTEKLVEMYGDVIRTLFDEPDDSKKIVWKADW